MAYSWFKHRFFAFVVLNAIPTILLALLVGVTLRRVAATPRLTLGTQIFEFAEPKAMLLVLLLPTIAHLSLSSLAALSRAHRIVLAMSRSTLLLLLALALSLPSQRVTIDESCSLFLVDGSPSMPDEALEEAERFAGDYQVHRQPRDTFITAVFDSNVRVVSGSLKAARQARGLTAASDYGLALRMAQGLCPAGPNRRVVLFGDGRDTRADLWPAARRLKEQGFALHVVPSRHSVGADVAVQRVTLPKRLDLARPFVVHGELFATRPTDVTLDLALDHLPNPGDSAKHLRLSPGHQTVSFESVVQREGRHQFQLSVQVDGPDAFSENNQASISVDVSGQPKLLVIDSKPDAIGAFAEALRAQKFNVDVRLPVGLPTSDDELKRFDFLTLSNVGSNELAEASLRRIERFVQEGGTLLVSGGPNGFAEGGWSGSRLETMLPVWTSARSVQQRHDLALVLAIDRSGSMTGLPLQLAKSACAATVEALDPSDLIEVLAFDAKPTRYVRMQPVTLRSAIINDLSRMSAGGDTELFYALDMAYQDLVSVEARRKHVILLTDGQSQTTGLAEVVQAMVADGITLTTVGLGTGVDVELLRHLAERGGGRYHAAPNPESLPKIFLRETSNLAKPPDEAKSFEVRVNQKTPFLRGVAMDEAPLLFGYHRTTPKPRPASVVLKSDRDEPILAKVPQGQGTVIAWTSDLHPRWAKDFLNWSHIGQLFSQLFRSDQSNNRTPELPMVVQQLGEKLTVRFDALRDDGTFDNDRSILLNLLGPGENDASQLVVTPSAPGLYEATTELRALGDYRLEAHHRAFDAEGNAKPLGKSHAAFSLSYPTEYATLSPDLETLAQLARFAQTGPVLPDTLARAKRQPNYVFVPRKESVLWVAFFWFLADLAAKRIRFRRKSA